jgi:serine-type D-Ala-D-Ala carboxypeptidase/endopeptidase (penicillin-binding protein 4)
LDSAYLYGAPFQSDMRLFGTMPADRVSFTIRGQMPDPPTYLALRFAEELRRSGVEISGAALSLRTLNTENQAVGLPKTSLFKTTSPPLSQIIRVIHEKSDNFYTECLLRHLALTVSTKPATAREGIRVVREFWKNKGMDLSALILFDASGLSPNDRVSAGFLARLLRHTAQDEKLGKAFEESLPLAGVEGTVSGFLKNTPLEGQLRLKSGSNQMVNSYAGFYRKNGKSYAVVMMVNGADATRFQIRKDLETFLLSL